MDQLIQHIELFEAYQAKTLDESAVLEFESRLNADSEFRKAYQDFQTLEENLKIHFKNEFFNQLHVLDEQLDKELAQEKKYSLKKIVLYSSSIAASLFILFFGYTYYQTQKNLQIVKQYWPIEPGLPVKMSSKGKYDEAMNAYKLGEWEEAVEEFSKIESDTSFYFLGVIAYNQKNKTKAIKYFSQINKNSSYFNTTQFRLGLIFLYEGKSLKAKKIFNIQKIKRKEFSEAAKEILKKI